jgi:hypothetical protein
MFYSELCKKNGVKDFPDEEYEIIRRWWYEFKAGNGDEWDSGCDLSLEEMKAELAEFDEGREKHTCATCDRRINMYVCKGCRTGNNDDYTLSDFWKSHEQIEMRLRQRIQQLQADKKNQTDKLTEAKEIIKDLLSLCEGETDSKLVFTRAKQFFKD